jgi:hypothetical protein
MRLLDARALIYQGIVRLVDDHDVGGPHYAILSHTWREEEVLFEDIPLGPDYEITTISKPQRKKDGYRSDSRLYPEWFHTFPYRRLFESKASRGAGICSQCESVTDHIVPSEERHVKVGWNKVLNTCLQACRDGIDYLWIDTCCIDKSSSAELSEAINSMFKWYEASAICYVYLDDCNLCPNPPYYHSNLDGWSRCRPPNPVSRCTIAQIQQCRWLTRGWTLQELIAPRHVAFFDRRWNFICESTAITKALSDATGISERVFRPTEPYLNRILLRGIPIAEKMSWAANRETSRIEDEAYCLFGLFDINMPLLYGEGEKAFVRLQEEIMKTSADHSILAWEFRDICDFFDFSEQLLAPSPAFFAWVTTIPRTVSYNGLELDRGIHGPYDRRFGMTNEGLNIWLPLHYSREENDSKIALALLDVRVGIFAEGQSSLQVALHLRQTTLKDRYLYSDVTSVEPSKTKNHGFKFMNHIANAMDHRRLVFFAPSSLDFELEPTHLMIRRGPKGY